MFVLPFHRRRLLADPKKLGRWGEKRCEKHLKSKGYKTIARNYSCAYGEIDLIVADIEGGLVFVEVKTRRDETIAPAHAAVNRKKRQKMYRTARIFLKTYRVKDKPLRFDVVTVILGETWRPEICHYENAFVP